LRTHTCQQKLSLPHKKGQEKQTHWNHTKQEGTCQGQQVAEVKESKGLKLSFQLSKAQAYKGWLAQRKLCQESTNWRSVALASKN
jgi:hypothetical protein